MYNMVNNVNKIFMNIDLYSLDLFLNFVLIENLEFYLEKIFKIYFYDKYFIYLKICLKELFFLVIEIYLFYFMK